MRRLLLLATVLSLASSAGAQLPLLKDNSFIYAHHHLNVPDIAAAKKFWVDTLGGTAVTAGPLQMVKLPNVIIVFTQRAPTGGTNGTTVNHVGVAVPNLRKMLDKIKEVKNLEAFCKQLEAQGITFDRPYTFIPQIGFAIAFLTDPFGTYIELTEGMDNPRLPVQ